MMTYCDVIFKHNLNCESVSLCVYVCNQGTGENYAEVTNGQGTMTTNFVTSWSGVVKC